MKGQPGPTVGGSAGGLALEIGAFDRAQQQAQMNWWAGGESSPPGPGKNSAGLALFRYQTRCGTVYGHTGSFPGYAQFAAATADGSRALTTTLNGFASDDGLPDPPAALDLLWTQKSGPPGVTFTAPTAAVTDATFPGVGAYVLELSASDGELASASETTVTVHDGSVLFTFQAQVAASADDAEETASGKVRRGSSDLELVFDGNRTMSRRNLANRLFNNPSTPVIENADQLSNDVI